MLSNREILRNHLYQVLLRELPSKGEFGDQYSNGYALGYVKNLSEIEVYWFLDQDFNFCVFEEGDFCFSG